MWMDGKGAKKRGMDCVRSDNNYERKGSPCQRDGFMNYNNGLGIILGVCVEKRRSQTLMLKLDKHSKAGRISRITSIYPNYDGWFFNSYCDILRKSISILDVFYLTYRKFDKQVKNIMLNNV